MNKSQDLYQTTRMRLTKYKNTKEKYISDKEIIEKLAIEIQQYRERIEKLNKTIRNLMKEDKNLKDISKIITTTHYVEGEVITKEELLELEDKDKFNVLINIVNGKVKYEENLNSASESELQKEIELIKHCIAEIQSKKKVHNKQLRKYIAYLKVAEKRLNIND